ncbi:MAG: transcription repressor NadR [Oscillospiraceae bacterium]|nr:transcription repressor NadR [Oscillospiraceae bacterium]
MNAEQRRRAIASALAQAAAPLSATKLAEQFAVSRQIVVGDIALLRAAGHQISATPRGYVLQRGEKQGLQKTVACLHSADQMQQELNVMVDNGCTVLDVVVEHPLYGQLTGPLMLRNRYDVAQFVARCAEQDAAPLSSLTSGIHLHTLLCPDEAAYARVRDALTAAGFLLTEKNC